MVRGDGLHREAGGVEALRVAHQLEMSAVYLVLLLVCVRVIGSLPLALAGLLLVVAMTIGQSVIQRPQVHGEFCFALLLFQLARPISWRTATVTIPLLLVFWANLHG